MTPTESLMLDAKQAILEEQHRRFRALQQDGRVEEALQQFHVTLACASDLLSYSLAILEGVLARQRRPGQPPAAPSGRVTP
ncbi:hypothetical protein [Nitrospira sp. Kam-Ns4a]